MDLLSTSLLYGLLLYNVDPIHTMLAKDILYCCCVIVDDLGLLGFTLK